VSARRTVLLSCLGWERRRPRWDNSSEGGGKFLYETRTAHQTWGVSLREESSSEGRRDKERSSRCASQTGAPRRRGRDPRKLEKMREAYALTGVPVHGKFLPKADELKA